MGRFATGGDDDAVERAIGACDLAQVRGRVFAELSGGQQRRVLLARAVAQSAGAGRVMLLDEPASGMDLRHVHQTMKRLGELAQQGLAVLVVMHDVNLAAAYADDVWLMDDGQIVRAGPWYRVLEPEMLERVYGVRFTAMTPPGDAVAEPGENGAVRPVFYTHPADTMPK